MSVYVCIATDTVNMNTHLMTYYSYEAICAILDITSIKRSVCTHVCAYVCMSVHMSMHVLVFVELFQRCRIASLAQSYNCQIHLAS